MFEKNNLENRLRILKKKNLLGEFILKTFNYRIEDGNKIDFYVQEIGNDAILYIFEKKDKNVVNTYEFMDYYNDVYLEKSVYRKAIINTVHIKKCIELYDEGNIVDNVILFCKALNSNNQKEILLEYLDKNIVDVLVDE